MIKTYHYGDTTMISEHFKACEFQCKCSKKHDFSISEELVQNLERLRAALGCSRMHISSGFRCPEHDKEVGGKGNGKHTMGLAADVVCYLKDGLPISSKIVSCRAQDIGFRGIANINAAYTSTHLDMREGKKWYGDETQGTSWGCDDLYAYYGIQREDDNMSYRRSGIDISYCQPKVDWSEVVTDFVILRAGYGQYTKQKDAMFESHYDNAKAKGIPVGAYWYSYAMSVEDAEREAEACIEILKGKQFEYPIYYDVEEKKQFDLGKGMVSSIIRAFLKKLEAAGYWVGLYSSYSALLNYVDDDIKKRYAIWLAHWVTKTDYPGQYGMWQYGFSRNVPGFDGNVDVDYCYVDYPSQIKAKGLNGFSNDPEPEPIPDIKMGDKGEDVVWMQTKLVKAKCLRENEIDGSFGRITRGALFEFQYESELPLTGVCDSVTREKLEAV